MSGAGVYSPASHPALSPADQLAFETSQVLAKPFVAVQRRGRDVVVEGVAHHAWGSPGDGVGYAEWRWDGATLEARTDRFGFRPLFYWEHGEGVAVAASLLKLVELGAPTELDDAALAVFLRVGFFLAEDTPFRAVRVLPPGGRLTWRSGTLEVTGGYPTIRHSDVPRDDAIDGYIAVVRDAVRRSLPARDGCAIPLSGGRDSRHILLELFAAGAPPDVCLTLRNYPPRGGRDLAVAPELARALGVAHVVLDEDPSRVRAELRKNLATHLCADEHAWFVPLADYVRGRWGTIYDGLAGDVLSAGHRLDAHRLEHMRTGRLAPLAALLCDEGHVRFLPREQARRFSHALAVERMVAELERHVEAPNPVGSFFFWNRTRREVALVPFGLMDGSVRVVTPFLDGAVYDFIASLPAHLFIDRRFHTDAIRRAHPRFAHIPFDNELTGPGPSLPAAEVRRHYRLLLREIAEYAIALPDPRLVRRGVLLARTAYWMMRGDFSDAPGMVIALYLMQLERIARWRD
jgi:asparagine synthase (glutamine-hydrolysing)